MFGHQTTNLKISNLDIQFPVASEQQLKNDSFFQRNRFIMDFRHLPKSNKLKNLEIKQTKTKLNSHEV
jgi:hypothetical protein